MHDFVNKTIPAFSGRALKRHECVRVQRLLHQQIYSLRQEEAEFLQQISQHQMGTTSLNTGSEKQDSSNVTSGVKVFPMNATEAIEDVITTLLIVGTSAQEERTLIVPFTAGSISSI
ncbi:hypothetical protein EUGRSUZ_G03337 [Eucalyptus grandis]|uniref:Uncharacterized protein n=2 Tax=Eucalyptus grandis TaxID=71139 RepID=A0A059BJJ7_EUCGR|nr:hypothetical protein EUGRSUZ_G03337 [Eucalyptus grandis]